MLDLEVIKMFNKQKLVDQSMKNTCILPFSIDSKMFFKDVHQLNVKNNIYTYNFNIKMEIKCLCNNEIVLYSNAGIAKLI